MLDLRLPARLDHAEATYDSVRGRIASSWTRSGSTLTLDVTVPPNTTGVVYIPGSGPASVKVSDTANSAFVGKQGNRLVYNVDSGSYRFTVSNR